MPNKNRVVKNNNICENIRPIMSANVVKIA